MTLQELLTALRGQGDASGYLSDQNSNPAVGRVQRYPSGIPLPNTTGPDGMRLPLPRIQGGGPRMQAQKPEAYPMVFGPSVADANQPRPQQPMALPPRAPVMRFRDAATPVGPAVVDQPPPNTGAWETAPTGRFSPPDAGSAGGFDPDTEWAAAVTRVRSQRQGRDPTGLREAAQRELGPLRDRARRSEQVAQTPPRYWPRATR